MKILTNGVLFFLTDFINHSMRSVNLQFRKQTGAFFELLLVLTVGFGIFIHSATQSIILRNKGVIPTYNDTDFTGILLYELLALASIALFLKYRKWTIADFNLDFRLSYILIALLLVFLRNILSYSGTKLLIAYGIAPPSVNFDTGLFSIVSIIFINSFYEEILLIGYIFKRFEKFHPLLPLSFSLLLRVSFHTYQGWGMLPAIVTLGLVLGIYYLKYRKLAPVILAHAIGNLLNFLNYYHNWLSF